MTSRKRKSSSPSAQPAPLPPGRIAKLAELDRRLTELEQEYESTGGTYALQFGPDIVDHADEIFRATGVVGINNIVAEHDAEAMRVALGQCAADLHGDRVSEAVREQFRQGAKSTETPEYSRGMGAAGVVRGNVGFGFLFGQKNAFDDRMVGPVGGKQTRFEYQPMHAYNAKWLSERVSVLDTVLALGAKEGPAEAPVPMVSWDSTKYVLDAFIGTKKDLTNPHVDLYEQGVPNRRQMAIEMCQKDPVTGRARRLCYVPFSTHPDIVHLLSELDDRYRSIAGGFVSFKDDGMFDVLCRHAISFDSYHLAVWGDGVVHFEAFTVPDPLRSGVCRVQDRKLRRGEKLECIRVVCGTHRPTLDPDDLKKLNVLADAGFLPSLYRSKQHWPLLRNNLMCAKTTQFHKTRDITDSEAIRFQEALGSDPDQVVSGWSGSKKLVYGLNSE